MTHTLADTVQLLKDITECAIRLAVGVHEFDRKDFQYVEIDDEEVVVTFIITEQFCNHEYPSCTFSLAEVFGDIEATIAEAVKQRASNKIKLKERKKHQALIDRRQLETTERALLTTLKEKYDDK